MAGDEIRVIFPVVYLSGDERLDPEANPDTPLDFTSLLNFSQALTQENSTLLAEIKSIFPFVEAIDPFWFEEHPVFRVTLLVDLDADDYPNDPPSEPDPELIIITDHQEWPFNPGTPRTFYHLCNRIFYVPAGNWDEVTGRFYIPLTLTDTPDAIVPVTNFLNELYDWSDGGIRDGRQGGGGP